MTRQEMRNRLSANIALQLQIHAALICNAENPFAMLDLLRPHITDPAVRGGQLPALYVRLAEEVSSKRTPLVSPTAH